MQPSLDLGFVLDAENSAWVGAPAIDYPGGFVCINRASAWFADDQRDVALGVALVAGVSL
jgi:hypothetical protein